MPIRSPRTARNMTARPVEVGATESILSALADTDSLIELPNALGSKGREWVLDIMQDINLAVEEAGEERFYWEHSTLETTHSRSMDLLEAPDLLTIAAQLDATAWYGDLPPETELVDVGAGEYLERATTRVLLGLRHLMWETAAALIGDGVLTWNGKYLVWHEDEVTPSWRPEGVQ